MSISETSGLSPKTPLRVLFMGTPDFAVPCLQALIDNPEITNVVAVYTQPDRPAGRGRVMTAPPVKELAVKHGIPVYQPENVNQGDEPRHIADLMVDAIVVVAYAQFLGKAVLNTPRLGCFNVHASLLPKFRGAAPIQYALLTGEKFTGVTIQRMVPKMDAGPSLLQKSMEIPDSMMAGELYDHLSRMGSQALIESLRLLQNNSHTEAEQDESKATYAPLIKKEDGRINWYSPSQEIVNRVRAFNPWPSTYVRTNRGMMKIHQAAARKNLTGMPADAQPGQVFTAGGQFLVKCLDGWVELLVVQLEGKKALNAAQFLQGLKSGQGEQSSEIEIYDETDERFTI